MQIESNNKLKEIVIKNYTCYYFDDATKTKDFDFNNSLVQNHCVIGLIKQMYLLEFMMGLDIQYYLALKNLMAFAIELDIL